MKICFGLLLALSVGLPACIAAAGDPRAEPQLPRFTEEREAASLFFVRKHLLELMPLLEELKKNDPPRYQQEVREIFQVTEMLADLHDQPKRHDLELRIWKAENRALVVLARMGTKAQEQLRELAKELVDCDMRVLEIQVEQLERELGDVRAELARSRDHVEENIKARYEALVEKARKPKK